MKGTASGLDHATKGDVLVNKFPSQSCVILLNSNMNPLRKRILRFQENGVIEFLNKTAYLVCVRETLNNLKENDKTCFLAVLLS